MSDCCGSSPVQNHMQHLKQIDLSNQQKQAANPFFSTRQNDTGNPSNKQPIVKSNNVARANEVNRDNYHSGRLGGF